MATEQGSEGQVPEVDRSQVEEGERSRQCYKEKETTDRWKKASFILAVASILLLIGLATSLGVFLTSTECAPPPRRDNATTTFLGSAFPGTEVDYYCQAPLMFPAGSPSFTVTCSSDLRWGPGDVPLCGIYGKRQCSFAEMNLTVTSRPASTAGLEVEIILDGSSPPTSMQVNIPSYGDSLCGAVQDSATMLSRRQMSAPRQTATATYGKEAVVVIVVFERVDPTQPFEVRVRGAGPRLAVTVLQDDKIETVITSYPASPTTTAATDTAIPLRI